MKLIYDNSGVAAVIIPAPKFLAQLAVLDDDGNDTVTLENKLIHIANKDLPTGTKYEIIADGVDLSDRAFRNAWTYTADASVEKTSADLTAEELASYNMTENL
jgi:hypothetical protein